MKITKKALKTGNVLLEDGNGRVLKFTRKQALTQIKKFKKEAERRLINGYKFKHLELIEKDEYFCYSMA